MEELTPPIDQFSDESARIMTELLARAANNTAEGITINSMSAPDQALIYVNEGFVRLTGYDRSEAIGRNCRFLQGSSTDQEVVDDLRNAIRDGAACTVELLNFRKDGTPFWNRLSITPIRSRSGVITHYVGIQSDITELKETKERLQIANKDLSDFHQRLTSELVQAKMVQEFLLPAELPQSCNVRFASKFVPMDEIGGDFYDVLALGENIYGMLIADVTGHGIPAAMLTFMSSTTFKLSAPEFLSTAETLTVTNDKLFSKMPDDAFVTMFYVIYDCNSRTLTYTQAGHPDGFVLRQSTREIIPLTTGGTLVGVFSNDEITFTEKTITLLPGDRVLLYTDAILEVLDTNGPSDDIYPLTTFLNKSWTLSLEELFEALYDYGLHMIDAPTYPDDFTLAGFEVV